jgi:hypothetical protein
VINLTKIKDDYKRTTVSLKNEEYEILRFIAFKQKTSIAGVVGRLVTELVEDQEDIRDGLKAIAEKEVTMDWRTFKREKLGL